MSARVHRESQPTRVGKYLVSPGLLPYMRANGVVKMAATPRVKAIKLADRDNWRIGVPMILAIAPWAGFRNWVVPDIKAAPSESSVLIAVRFR